MTKLTSYSEAFWGPDYTSTAGFEALSRHNGEEKKFLSDFEDYLRKRSKLELEFSRSLAHLARSMRERTATGGIANAWNTLRAEVESCKQAHEEAGLFFTQHAEETKRFTKELTARRDNAEERLKKVQNQKLTQFKTVTSLCKSYNNKCREKDHLCEAYRVLRSTVTATVKDLEKAKTKMEKSAEDAEKADNQYKNAVATLEETRKAWEKEMERACKEFQENDEEQITFLRSEMWLAMNRISQVAVDVDNSCERVRKVLETCEIDQDIQSFISLAATGTQRPEPVLYQNYYETSRSSSSSNNNHRAATPSSADTFQRQLPATPDVGNHNASPYYSQLCSDADDPTYASADATYSVASPLQDPSPCQLTVIKSFQSPPDFTVQAGEKVTFLRRVTSNMVQVRTLTNKTGNLPLTCVKETV